MLPSRLELKRRDGSGSIAPRADVRSASTVFFMRLARCRQSRRATTRGTPEVRGADPFPLLRHLGVGFQDQGPHAGRESLLAQSPRSRLLMHYPFLSCQAFGCRMRIWFPNGSLAVARSSRARGHAGQSKPGWATCVRRRGDQSGLFNRMRMMSLVTEDDSTVLIDQLRVTPVTIPRSGFDVDRRLATHVTSSHSSSPGRAGL